MILTNYVIPTSVDDYIEKLVQNSICVSIDGMLDDNSNMVSNLFALFSSKAIFPRIKHIKNIVLNFCEDASIESPKVIVSILSKDTAYMTDDGKLTISFRLLKQNDIARTIKVVFHELAHFHLANQSNYFELLYIDKKFKQLFNVSTTTLSHTPLEIYATLLSCEYLKSISECFFNDEKTAILSQIDSEQIKIKNVVQSLQLIRRY